MMMVGNKDRFAIEFDLDQAKLADSKLSEWKYGRVRWWCGGEEVGRYEPDTTLRDVSIEAARCLENEGERQDERLMGVAIAEIVRTIAEALFEDHGQSDEQVTADDQRYRRFVVRPLVDVFDPWDVFLIEGEKRARLIWRRVKDGKLRERELAAGEFDAVLRRFVEALDVAAHESASRERR
jgi:hypothetical protein